MELAQFEQMVWAEVNKYGHAVPDTYVMGVQMALNRLRERKQGVSLEDAVQGLDDFCVRYVEHCERVGYPDYDGRFYGTAFVVEMWRAQAGEPVRA